MKTITLINKAIVISTLTALCCIASLAQRFDAPADTVDSGSIGRELRPFDFTDKYYSTHGIETAFIVNRRNGSDGESVIDFTSDENYSSVRILATRPAYAYDGSPIYWNLYGEFFKEAFKPGPEGDEARTLAESFPIYFPSTTTKTRPASRGLEISKVLDKNPLGRDGKDCRVHGRAEQPDDAAFLATLAKRTDSRVTVSPSFAEKGDRRVVAELVPG